jgi:protein TonB
MTRTALVGPRREAGVFPWALLAAAGLWAVLLLAWAVRFTPAPLASLAPTPVDARLVELPPTPPVVKPVPKPQTQPRPPRPIHEVKRPDGLPVRAKPKPALKPKPKPVPKPVVKPRPKPKPAPKVPPHPQPPQAAVNRDVMGARAVYSPLPQIPDDLRAAAMDEVAVARLHIHADGTVSVDLMRPTDNPRINRIILDTLRTWMFYPALDKGKPVASLQQIRIRLSVGD